jgi:hypothetical protein
LLHHPGKKNCAFQNPKMLPLQSTAFQYLKPKTVIISIPLALHNETRFVGTTANPKPLLTRRGIFHIRPEFSRSGETGKRSGLKIRRAQALVGSIPTSGTRKNKDRLPQSDPFLFNGTRIKEGASIFCLSAGSIIKTAWHPD